MASVATLLLFSSNQSKAHALKKFPWMKWLKDNKVGETPIELEIVKETEVEEAGMEDGTEEEVNPEEEAVEGLDQAAEEVVVVQEA